MPLKQSPRQTLPSLLEAASGLSNIQQKIALPDMYYLHGLSFLGYLGGESPSAGETLQQSCPLPI
jgi:hypothetical protein